MSKTVELIYNRKP